MRLNDCVRCGAANEESSRFCGGCGAELSVSSLPTVAFGHGAASPAEAAERFLPGQILGDRYRIVAPLGRGGMGEVYRADDLKLGQTVAIKLLPERYEKDPAYLERLRNEVRLSLQVTHPNVCRVFDLGEADGRHFLSMEYVDGEDLASLLRRIGRLPGGKAVDVARQLCAGLAAAHERGVLHRDLKPANVMIDGRGHAKITDFGLAGATEGIEGGEARVGTPGYQAPEQLAGDRLTTATDLYALGLVLYELFTGQRAFPGDRSADVVRRERSSQPSSPSSHVAEIDPVVERVVMHCLESDPGARPASALAVAAALPGGDPLAAALAAGETPSPEMVAQAGDEGSLRPAVAVSMLAAILLGLALLPWLPDRRLLDHIELPIPPQELARTARDLASEIGYPDIPVDRAWDFASNQDYFDYVVSRSDEPDRWDDLGRVRPSPVDFWYRESPVHIVPHRVNAAISPSRPALRLSGEILIRLDPEGRLLFFKAVPPHLMDAGPARGEVDWEALFLHAGLDRAFFVEDRPRWTELVASDARKAWKSGKVDGVGGELRVEAASLQGVPVYFAVIAPWMEAERMSDPSRDFGVQVLGTMTVFVLIAAGSIFLARRNRRLGRSHGQGARRVAIAMFALRFVSIVVESNHTPTPWELIALIETIAWSLLFGALGWVLYTAIEPYGRKLWPNVLIGWTRLLNGRVRDPLVGRTLLLGGVVGVVWAVAAVGIGHLTTALGAPPPPPWTRADALVMQAPWNLAAAYLIDQLIPSLVFPLWTLTALVILRVVARSQRLASVLFVVGLSVVLRGWHGDGLPFWIGIVVSALFWGAAWYVLTRHGFLAVGAMVLFVSLSSMAIGADPGTWHFPRIFVPLLLLAAVAIYGFVVSLGGQKLFRDVLAD